RDNGLDAALGEEAVADLAARLTAQRLDLSRRERREVVVHVERLLLVAEQRVELLLVVLGAQRHRDERLRLATGEQRRAVRARQHAGLDRDRADLVGIAAVDALAGRQRVPAGPLLLDLAERRVDVLRLAVPRLALGGERLDRLGLERRDTVGALLLVVDLHRLAEAVPHELLDLRDQGLVGHGRRERALLLAVGGAEALLQLDQRLDG